MKQRLRSSYFPEYESKLSFCLRISLLAIGMIMATVGLGYGQIKVSGQVVSADDGAPIPGATVLVQGTNNGAVTDIDGNYSITVENSDDVLVFSFVGYLAEEVPVNNRSVVNISLTVDVTQLEDVVVTALGIRRDRKSLSYAISKIEAEDLTIAGVSTNPVVSLYGKAAGVGIQTNSAGPTGAVDINIRGAAGLSEFANTRPLFVVDGMPIYDEGSSMATRGFDPLNSFDYGSGINDINPEDIESMEILKGAQATVLYGSRGANGVVLITTKKGKSTRGLGINIDTQYTIEKPRSYIEFQNEYGSGINEYDISYEALPDGLEGHRQLVRSRFNFGPKFDGSPIKHLDGSIRPYQAYPDNFIDLFKTGSNRITTLAVSGGSEMGHMRASYTNQDFQGILHNNYQKKHVFNFSGMLNASDFVNFEVNSNLYKIKTHNRYPNLSNIVAWGINRDYDLLALTDMYKNEDGSKFNAEDTGWPGQFAPVYYMDYLWKQREDSDLDDKFHYIGSLKTTLNFTDKFSFIGEVGLDYTDTDIISRKPITRYEPEVAGGRFAFGRRKTMVQNYRGILNYNTSILDGNLNLFTFIGGEYNKISGNEINVGTFGGLKFRDFWSIDNGVTWPSNPDGRIRNHRYGSQTTYSAFGSATLNWKNELYLELQARNDWSSTLPPIDNSYFYPGIGLSWNFTNTFDIPSIQFGKLRASWSDVGRGAPGNIYTYFANPSYSTGQINNSDALTVRAPGTIFAGQLKPERKREYEIGFDADFLEGGRLKTQFSFYHNNVYNQITSIDITSSSGASTIRLNAGDVANWGYELMLKGVAISNEKYRWDVTFTAAHQGSKVKDLYGELTKQVIGQVGNSLVVYAEEGKPYGEIHMYDYLTDEKGNRVVDNNGAYVLDKSELKPIGANIMPDVFGGFMSDFFFKGFNFHVGVDYKFGASIFSRSNYYLLGMGISEQSLKYRDQAHGGLAYYVDGDGNRVPWQHDQEAPADAEGGLVYHDGVINPGVVRVGGTDENPEYAPNDKIISAQEYYSRYINDLGEDYFPDALHKNNYVKLREVALSYSLPADLTEKMGIQKLTLSLMARNLFYLYKSIPNIDPESTLGTGQFVENSFYPTAQSYGLGLNISF